VSHPHIFRLDKPLESYSGHELENYILRWKRVQLNWVAGEVPILSRMFQTPEKTSNACLLPGGRRLLMGSMGGLVYYFDLGTPEPTPAVLVCSQIEPTHRAGHSMAIEIDVEATGITFDLALVVTTWNRVSMVGREALHRDASMTSREVIQEVVMEFRFEEPNPHILLIVTMILNTQQSLTGLVYKKIHCRLLEYSTLNTIVL